MAEPFTVDDLYLHHKVTESDCSSRAAALVCTVQSVDRNADDATSRLWGFALDGSWQRQLTQGPGHDKSPRWSPDGQTLAFLSDRGGSAQVHLLDMQGGEARLLGALAGAVSDLRWAADGRSLLVASAVNVDPDWRGDRPAGRQPAQGATKAEVAWKLPYKSDGIGYMLGREIHLFRLDAASGEASQLTDGPFDVLAFDASPDGKHIVFARTREGRFSHRTDLWVCDADGSQARQLTSCYSTVMGPRWSPDGRWIAFCGTEQEGDAQTYLYLLEFASGRVHDVGDDLLQVADVESLRWQPDSASLLCVQAWRGRHRIVRVEVPSGRAATLLDGDRQLSGFSACPSHLAYVVDHPSQPSELHACRADGTGERCLSDFNPWWRDRAPIVMDAREFQVPDGRGGTETIEGWLLRAGGARGALPLLDDVHGGPASYALLDFETNVYWQVLCAQGWAVLALNPVGSASYGAEFCERLTAHWGEYDLPQHLAAVRQLQREGVCDGRLAIAGKSYGGYLAGWAIGHTSTFHAAVVMAPVGNIETHYGTSDGGYYADPYYMGGKDRFDRRLAAQLSPMPQVERATTPTLFMQGKDDERCPKCQSEELFVSLMRAGKTPAELVLYPGQDHHFLGQGPPSVREDAARRIVDWLERHVGQVPAAVEKPSAASKDAATPEPAAAAQSR